MAVAQTIVRKVEGGSNPRFVMLYETQVATGGFVFTPASITMTLPEISAALIAAGISEQDARGLINEAVLSYERSQAVSGHPNSRHL